MHNRHKIFAVSLSVLSNSILVILKLIIGIWSGSVSVISEAIHSGIDLLAALIAWFAVLASSKPADARHPYGHGKFENLSGTVEALLIFLAAGWIIYEAIIKLNFPSSIEKFNLGVIIMALSSVINLIISNYLMKVGKETDSIAITADAWHLRTDVYTSAGVMIALVIMWCGQKFCPAIDLRWIDPISAIIVALLIIHAALKLTMQATLGLMDVSLPNNEIQWLDEYLRSLTPTVRGFHNLRTRKSGSSRFIEVHVIVDGKMTVTASHDITREIVDKICSRFPETNVTIHIEPCNQQYPSSACSIRCRNGCLVNK
jgi:cation diffusion facilitator family transporter